MVQPPPGDQPQQPMSGPQPPYDPSQPYGQPYQQQPQYGQPQYGQPQAPGGPPPYGSGGYYPPQPERGNGFAIAGIILAILVAPLGLIFSIIGLVKSKTRGGAGKALSIAGIVVSLIVGVAGGAGIAKLATSTAADAGCISAENAARQMQSTLNSDDSAMTRDQNNSAAEKTDLQHFLTDMQSLQQKWATAETQAHHQSVKTQIAAVISDMNTFTSSLQAIEQGNLSKVDQMTSSGNSLEKDANTLDSTCTSL
jgi:hypothetical protein